MAGVVGGEVGPSCTSSPSQKTPEHKPTGNQKNGEDKVIFDRTRALLDKTEIKFNIIAKKFLKLWSLHRQVIKGTSCQNFEGVLVQILARERERGLGESLSS